MYSDENAAILGHSVDQELEEHSLGLQQFHASKNISNFTPCKFSKLKKQFRILGLTTSGCSSNHLHSWR